MNDLGVRIIGAIFAGLAVAGMARIIIRPTPRLSNRVRPYVAASRSVLGRAPDRGSGLLSSPASPHGVIGRLYRPLVESVLAQLTKIFGSAFSEESLTVRLKQAGILTDVLEADRAHEYRVRQVGSGLGFGMAFGLCAALIGLNPAADIALFALGVVIGVARRSGDVGKRIESRRDRMRVELYTINQLLAIYLRTSGSPVLAAQRLVRRGRGDVIDELNEALRLHTRGLSASRAFTRISESTPEPFAARTYKLLASGAERGADLANALLSLSEDVRDNRRTEVRRTATKRQGAMLVPIIACLAPVMLLFIAGPLPSLIFGQQ